MSARPDFQIYKPDDELRLGLIIDSRKKPIACNANILIVLRREATLQGITSYNEFSQRRQINFAVPTFDNLSPVNQDGYPRPWTDSDTTLLIAFMDKFYVQRCSNGMMAECLDVIAMEHRFNPVRDWLESLVWNRKPLLNQWLCKVYGCPEDDYHFAIGSKMLIAAVKRIFEPGCYFDQMIVLEGEQGVGKSKSIASLFSQQWFSDRISNLGSKDAAIDMVGKWCVEIAELQQFSTADIETVKAFLSCSTDRYRSPYGKIANDHPRQWVLFGTTNGEQYLRDPTGARRFWPVRCKYVDKEWLEENREQLWAEAYKRCLDKEKVYLETALLRRAATEQQENRYDTDPWHETIESAVEFAKEVSTDSILKETLKLEHHQMTGMAKTRVRKILQHLGYRNQVTKEGGKSVRKWKKL